MLTRFEHGANVERSEPRRGRKHDDVDVGLKQFLIGIEAREAGLRGYLDGIKAIPFDNQIAVLSCIATDHFLLRHTQFLQGALNLIGKNIGERADLDVGRRKDGIHQRADAAIAAADEADLDLVWVSGGICTREGWKRGCEALHCTPSCKFTPRKGWESGTSHDVFRGFDIAQRKLHEDTN